MAGKPLAAWKAVLWGFLLLPILGALGLTLWTLPRVFSGTWLSLWPLGAGLVSYLVLLGIFRKPLGLYVFGHEVTHAAAAFFSGYRIKSMTVSPQGGHVIMSDSNLFVALAPYCVPLYTVILLAVFQAARFYKGMPLAQAPAWCSFGVGLTWAFHADLTFFALRRRQPDLRHGGSFLSLILILLINGFMVVLLLKALFPAQISLKFFTSQWACNSLFCFKKLLALGRRLL